MKPYRRCEGETVRSDLEKKQSPLGIRGEDPRTELLFIGGAVTRTLLGPLKEQPVLITTHLQSRLSSSLLKAF